MVLYRKYRPQKLSELFGQETVVKTLLSQLESGKISHGYLFSGPRGTGKTSAARIFARAINCEKYNQKAKSNRHSLSANRQSLSGNKQKVISFGEPCNKCEVCLSMLSGSSLDLIEIDAASNRGIDEVRDLREKVKFAPVSAKYKVYIIDEAHMLTNEAFNALLKTLEEPPNHVVFILATTEFSKLPSTIISRLTQFNFDRASGNTVLKLVEKVAKEEKIKLSKEAAIAISQSAEGSFRDALSLLDQVHANGDLTTDDIANLAKTIGWNSIMEFSSYLSDMNLKAAVSAVEKIASNGSDISFFTKQIVLFLEKLLFIKIGNVELTGDYDAKQIEEMEKLADRFEWNQLQNLMKLFMVAEGEVKVYPLPQIPLVLAVCKYCGEAEQAEIRDQRLEVRGQTLKNEKAQEEAREITGRIENEPHKSVAKKKISSKVNLAEIEKKWAKYLENVKNLNAHVVALLRATRPTDLDGDILTLEVFYRFHKEKLEEPKIIRMLDGAMDEVMGVPIRLKFVLAKRETEPTKVVKSSDVAEISDKNLGDLEKIAHEIFSE